MPCLPCILECVQVLMKNDITHILMSLYSHRLHFRKSWIPYKYIFVYTDSLILLLVLTCVHCPSCFLLTGYVSLNDEMYTAIILWLTSAFQCNAVTWTMEQFQTMAMLMSKSFWSISVTEAQCPYLNSTRILMIFRTSPQTTDQVKVAYNGKEDPRGGSDQQSLFNCSYYTALYLGVAEGCLFSKPVTTPARKTGQQVTSIPLICPFPSPPHYRRYYRRYYSRQDHILSVSISVFSQLSFSRIVSWHSDTTNSRDACPSLKTYLRCHEDIFQPLCAAKLQKREKDNIWCAR